MNTRNLLAPALVSITLISLALLAACGSSSSTPSKVMPVFTSTPVTAATEGVVYTYQLAAVDPAGGSVTFALTSSPTGAALSGNTLTWTPTATQSRVSNPFAVTATSSGGTASQSWKVTPGGTITVNWVNNYWAANGPVQVPAQASAATNLSAMWTNADGSITVQKSSAAGAGVFSIPNVPGGYYWLQTGSEAFWTSASTFDAGQDFAGGPAPTISGIETTQFNLNLSGLEPVPEATLVNFVIAVSGFPAFGLFDDPDSTSLSQDFAFGSDIDWSQVNTAFLTQLVPSPLGSLNNLVLGSAVTATNLSLVTGGTNTITETLQPSPQTSINLSVPGSQWAPLLASNNVAPMAPTPLGSALDIVAQMYVTQGLVSGTVPLGPGGGVGVGVGFPLAPPLSMVSTEAPNSIDGIGCNSTGFILTTPTVGQGAITTDQNFGTLQYGDPFPQNWARTLSLCQEATVWIPVPGTTTPATFLIVDSATVAPSNAPLAPVVLPVQNPTVNGGGSLFGATDIANTNIVTLSWTAPSETAPFGYTVRVYVQTTIEGMPTYSATGAAFSTAGISITLPPLAGGNTYVFAITADADGTANMQTSPFRSSLPVGYATVVSGPVTIGSGALMPEIHGDRRVITRLSQPQPRPAKH